VKVVAIVQARLGSSRLPAKVMLDLEGKTALERCLRRVERTAGVHEVVVATTDAPVDDLVERLASRLGYRAVRGSENDVLARYQRAASISDADVVMRCTSDCPLLDPLESAEVLSRFLHESQHCGADYVSNVMERRLPRGLDTEVLSRAALERAHAEATAPELREHVTLHVVRHPEQFRCVASEPVLSAFRATDHAHRRWTLDTLEDYHFLAALFAHLGDGAEHATSAEILAVLERYPQLERINQAVAQKVV
jgi:spore coat polysaccharide biosynthesis protein SpsF